MYENIPGDYRGFENMNYLLDLENGNRNDLKVVLHELIFTRYRKSPDILAKCFRIVANISCLPDELTNPQKREFAGLALLAMREYPLCMDLQSKCLALFVNIHEVYSDLLAQLIPTMVNAVLHFDDNEYLLGKYVYIIENFISDGYLDDVSQNFDSLRPGLFKAKKFKKLRATVRNIFDTTGHGHEINSNGFVYLTL